MSNVIHFKDAEIIEAFGEAKRLGLAVVLARYSDRLVVGLMTETSTKQRGQFLEGAVITLVETFPLHEEQRAQAAGRLVLKALEAAAAALENHSHARGVPPI